jgi:FMN phosphatase YigB (HAD superfamily)
MELFDLDRELYDGHDFIVVLPDLAKRHEAEVGQLLVQLSKDAHHDADAPASLQQAMAEFGDQHTSTFSNLLKSLPENKQGQLITFLADVEVHSSYREYKGIIDHLRRQGDDSLADKFEAARRKRSLQSHD